MKRVLIFSLMLISVSTFAQPVADTLESKVLEGVTVTGTRNIYKIDSTTTVSKMPLKDLENPQVYNTISKIVLKDQVITNLNNALKNATGIVRLWESTGRGGDGAEFYSMRGFAVQPTMMNGLPNITSGTIDPVNIENVEVIKGPSGTLFGGSLISYGGLINIVTKKPYETFGGEVGFVAGSYGLNRFTADVNTPLSKKAFARVNAAYHYENSFQDQGFNKSLYIAPSFKFNASDKLTFLINSEFRNSESPSIPMQFLNRFAPLTHTKIDAFERNYEKSFGSNSLTMKNPGFAVQAQALYKLSSSWTSQTMLSTSNSKTDGYYQYLYDFADGETFGRYISKRNGATNAVNIQQNFIGDFKIGKLRNRMIVGLDYLHRRIENNSTSWEFYGTANIPAGIDSTNLSVHAVDAAMGNWANATAETEIMSAYISDVINFTPKLSAMLSLRVDNFNGKPLYSLEDIKSQTTVSPKFGLVYQPILNKLSLFANYMNGFNNLVPQQVTDINGNNPTLKIFDPEHANQWEVGAKANLYKDKISLTASYYNILVANRTMTDPDNINNVIQGGEVSSKGFELSVVTNPIEGLSIIAGYSHNDSKVTKDYEASGYLGLRPEEAGPADLVNFWATYRVQNEKLKGLHFGFGANYASEYLTLNRANIGTFALPSYTIFNGVVGYATGDYSVNFKIDNIANTKYYTGWSTVTPQRPRAISVGLSYKF